ncbi:MAG: Rieske 2Fe-2S domain-containing protein [Porticoccus sp.]|nr:Rieske 2Fe-2S domain-containing protein [Porticoccus sp.]
MQHALGKVNDIKEGECKAYTLTINHKSISLFVVRHCGQFYAYQNHCPHTGIPLNWHPNQFLDITNQYIQCNTHGALFRVNDGLCEWAPCLGKYLRPLNIYDENGKLTLTFSSHY